MFKLLGYVESQKGINIFNIYIIFLYTKHTKTKPNKSVYLSSYLCCVRADVLWRFFFFIDRN